MNTINNPTSGTNHDGSGNGNGNGSHFGSGTGVGFGAGIGAGAPAEQTLFDPLPYGTGFSSPQPLGFGVGPIELGSAAAGATGSSIAVPESKRSGSPVLAAAGLLSMGVAVWAILGAPVITPTVLLAAGLVLMVLVGLVMVIRR